MTEQSSQPEAQHKTALDSDEKQVGTLYAKAILGAAGEDVDQVVGDLEAVVAECLDRFPAMEQALASPRLSQEHKEAMLDRVFNGRVHGSLLNFMKVLCRRDRIASLRAIQTMATRMREEQLGKLRVTVTSAQPLSDDQRRMIGDRLRERLGKDPVLEEKVDDGLLGGIVLRIGDRVVDGSALGRIAAIKESVAQGVQRALRDRFDSLLSSS